MMNCNTRLNDELHKSWCLIDLIRNTIEKKNEI